MLRRAAETVLPARPHRADGRTSSSPITHDLSTPAQFLKGVGPKRYELLKKLGIVTVRDLLHHFPRGYLDRSVIKPIAQAREGALETVRGEVLKSHVRRTRSGPQIAEVLVGDDSGVIAAVWFNMPFMAKRFNVGDQVILTGKVGFYDRLQIERPEFEILGEGDNAEPSAQPVLPIYPLTEDLYQSVLRRAVGHALDEFLGCVEDMFDEAFRAKRGLLSVQDALRDIHFPESKEIVTRARQRLVYDEFFLLEVGMALRRQGIKQDTAGIAFKIGPNVDERIRRLFPFRLTRAQERAIAEITEDMRSPKPMNRLLQGDVGSGKTVVAIYALLAAIANGYQAAIMAPTEILAEQHYMVLLRFLASARVRLLLVSGASSRKERKENLGRIQEGEADLVVGTQALIEGDVEFRNLGLVVVDEQHKFGVLQRAKLRRKGVSPDVLVMTATPIPRTLALTVFGDLDVSVLDEMPPGRRPVQTRWVPEVRMPEAFGFIRNELAAGRQAFIVYPLVEESEELDLKSATEMAEKLQRDVFPEFKLGLLHGQMKSTLKDDIMTAFRDRKHHVLVSTVVIEVGIDVPNASVMVIEHAERYGLAQLHQLRGRIGRGSHTSYCLLFGDPKSPEAEQRLRVMTQTTDGFRIAEEDLRLRGPGEFFGTRQHGLPELKIANIIDDHAMLRVARQDAFDLVKADPTLNRPLSQTIRRRVMETFAGRLELINVG